MGLYHEDQEIENAIWNYLDKEFEEYVKRNPDFQFSQIKIKFGTSRIYTNAEIKKEQEWEQEVNKILNEEE